MKSWIKYLVIVLLVMAMAGMVEAKKHKKGKKGHETGSNHESSATTPITPVGSPSPDSGPTTQPDSAPIVPSEQTSLAGTVKAILIAANESNLLILQDGTSQTVRCHSNIDTTISVDGAKGMLADIKVGMAVKISLNRCMATNIEATTGK